MWYSKMKASLQSNIINKIENNGNLQNYEKIKERNDKVI